MKLCPECGDMGVSLEEIGWRKLRLVGESPRGYRFKVLTIRVPTAVIQCAGCGWDEHGYIHEGSFVVDENIFAKTEEDK